MQAVQTVPQMDHMKQWARVMAHCQDAKYRYVRVLGHTASITNGHMLLRRETTRPDGFYEVDEVGNLCEVVYSHGFGYPDLDALKPSKELAPLCRLDNAMINAIASFSQKVREVEGTLVIGRSSMYMLQNAALELAFPFNAVDPIRMNPLYIHLAMLELLRYDFVWMLKRPGESPVIFGKDWGSCALVMPLRG